MIMGLASGLAGVEGPRAAKQWMRGGAGCSS
jgi:hypothetical protein